MAIDWDYLTRCYNKRNKTNYSTSRALLKSLYAKHETCNGVAKELLLSRCSVYLKMKAQKLALKPKGHRGLSKGELAIVKLNADDIKNMTCLEIANKIDFSLSYTRLLLDGNENAYKKSWTKKVRK